MKSRVPRFKLPRRSFLRGLLGVGVGLPVLECMLDANGRLLDGKQHFSGAARAQASTLPKRYAIVFAGQALGGDTFPEDQYRIGDQVITESGHFIVPPEENTSSYTVTTPLIPLRDEDLLGDFSLVSGLRIPFNANSNTGDGSDVPVGGAFRDFHGGGSSPLLSGMRSTSSSFVAQGPTSDQLIAQLNAGQTNLPSLVVRAQPAFYINGFDFSGREFISYTQGGSGGRVVAQDNPGNAWSSLFSNFTPEGEDQVAIHDFTQRKRISVLDLVLAKRDRLLAKVSASDRVRLERHFDELRALEDRVRAVPPLTGPTCSVLDNPGTTWPVGGDNAGSGADEIQSNTGYSDEDTRAQLYVDMIHMAFVCDLTRAATLQITAFQSHMNVIPLVETLAARVGHPGLTLRADLHEVGHNGDGTSKGQLQVSMMLMWHITHYARLLKKLKVTPEGDGNVLDNSAIIFMPEAGHGVQLNDGVTDLATHSVDRMVLLVGGRAGGLSPGRHLATGGAVHPAQVLLAAMQACGYGPDTFGEVSGAYSDLFG